MVYMTGGDPALRPDGGGAKTRSFTSAKRLTPIRVGD